MIELDSSATMACLKNFIKGSYIAPHSGMYFDSLNPSTGEVLCRIPDSSEKDIEMAVQAATTALPAWSKTSREYRSTLLMKLADLLEAKLQFFGILDYGTAFRYICSGGRIPRPR